MTKSSATPTASPILKHRRRLKSAAGEVLLICAAVAMLAGCSSDSGASWPQIIGAARKAFNSDSAITREQAAAVPYASLGIRLDGGHQQMIVLASDTQGSLLWTSAARIALVTEHGRIMRTAGLSQNLNATVFQDADALRYFEGGGAEQQTNNRTVDFQDINKFSVLVRCTMALRGSEDIVILGRSLHTRRVEEHCESTTLDWSFDNVFWIGGTPGLVWRSVQYVHPQVPAIELDTLRPAAGGD